MRKLQLSKSGLNKIKSHNKELKIGDIEDSIKSLPPGEWCKFSSPSTQETWFGFVNPLIDDKYACVHVLGLLADKNLTPESYIKETLERAYQKRRCFRGYEAGSRLFYGASDGLPGLIIDHFTNGSVIQINTSGVDRFRDLIRDSISELTKVKAYFLDNSKYREKEFLPTFQNELVPSLTINENNLKYVLRSEVMQKVGFYYDHRENRLQLQALLKRLEKIPERGVDLFCYAGAWGLNALNAGVKFMDFVDQGDLEVEVKEGLTQNNFPDQGKFFRADVFKFLDEAISKKIQYDLILCDPPAFAKSVLQKSQALEGYSKLHRKVFKLATPGAICAFSSCTHYVGHEEFQKNIIDAAHKEGKKLQLLYCGMQGWDHPVTSLEDRANYIKSYIYILE